MSEFQTPENEPHPLADIDQVIHSSARLMILVNLFVVESLDYVFLKNQTGLSWGNLATHLNKLEKAGYITVEKSFKGRKPHTMIHLTSQGREAFRDYKSRMQQVLDDLPE